MTPQSLLIGADTRWPDTLLIGTGAFGVLGADIPGEGDDGPAILWPSLQPPTDAAREYLLELVEAPASGTLDLQPNGVFSLTGAAPGSYTLTVRVYETTASGAADLGLLVTPITVQAVGAGPVLSGAVSLDLLAASGSMTAPAVLGGTLQLDAAAGAGLLASASLSMLSGACDLAGVMPAGDFYSTASPTQIMNGTRMAVPVGNDARGALGKHTQQPHERLDYIIDFGRWIGSRAGDTIASHDVLVDDALTLAHTRNGAEVAMLLGGGVDGETYVITTRVTTAVGAIKEAEFKLRIKEFS